MALFREWRIFYAKTQQLPQIFTEIFFFFDETKNCCRIIGKQQSKEKQIPLKWGRSSEHIRMWFINLFPCISSACHLQQLCSLVNIVMLLIQKSSSWISNMEIFFFCKEMKYIDNYGSPFILISIEATTYWHIRFDKNHISIRLHNCKIGDNPDAVMQKRIFPMKVKEINCSSWTIQITHSFSC